MLAQSFMSADELHITEPQRDALQKVLVLLETGKLTHVSNEDLDYDGDSALRFDGLFNMQTWCSKHTCGTVGCIAGTAEIVAGSELFSYEIRDRNLSDLFNPWEIGSDKWQEITPSQAARALRSYLTTGGAKWSEAVS